MKINAYGNVSTIRFTHKGNQMNLECIQPCKFGDWVDVREPGSIAFFEFTDTVEIEYLIRMLQRFKQESENAMGRWQRTEVKE